jgi:hypothetical protein
VSVQEERPKPVGKAAGKGAVAPAGGAAPRVVPAPVAESAAPAPQRSAASLAPELYAIAQNGPVSFQHVVQARRIRQLHKEYFTQSFELEGMLRRRFVEETDDPVVSEYYCVRAYGGCALTKSGALYSVLNTYATDVMEIEAAVKQLDRDALRVFAPKRHLDRRNDQVWEICETLYSVMTRVMATADVLTKDPASASRRPKNGAVPKAPSASDAGREEALVALHREWDQARKRVLALVQREARFAYFAGVMAGVVVAVALFGALAALADRFWQDQVETPSLVASTVAGAVGAAVSVTQRMANGTLVLDFTASRPQKLVLGAARPVVGAVFACVVQFALLGGLLTMGTTKTDQTSATFAFFAVIGFASGFSERLATDILERAGAVLTAAPKPDGPQQTPAKLPTPDDVVSVPPPPITDPLVPD